MIQRKQTLFLLVAVIASLLCFFMPIGVILPKGMGGVVSLYNLGFVDDNGTIIVSGTCLPLFILLAVSTALSLATIFLYKNRKLQLSLCATNLLLSVLWYIDYALLFFGMVTVPEVEGNVEVKFAACLPLIAIIMVVLARKGVADDEKLVRAADRIR
jgi:hypothetical protein